MIDVDIDATTAGGNIDNGVIFMHIVIVVVAKSARAVAKVNFRAGVTGGSGFHVLPAGGTGAVTVTMAATVVVFMVDLGYNGAVREPAALNFKVVVGVLAACAGAGGALRNSGHGETAVDIA